MKLKELIKWQWEGYSQFHQSRKNLIIHIIFVPLFMVGFFSFLLALLTLNISILVASILLMLVSFGAQGFGHSRELIPAVPFENASNALIRILAEQLYTFPKFVLTGKWLKALMANH